MSYKSYSQNHVHSWYTTEHDGTAIIWAATTTGDYMLEVIYQSPSRDDHQYVLNVN